MNTYLASIEYARLNHDGSWSRPLNYRFRAQHIVLANSRVEAEAKVRAHYSGNHPDKRLSAVEIAESIF